MSVESVNVHLHTAARPVSPALRVRIAAKSIKAVQSQAFKRGSMNNRCETECQAYYVKLVDTKDDLPGPLCKMMSREDHCFYYFSYSRSAPYAFMTVAKATECPHA